MNKFRAELDRRGLGYVMNNTPFRPVAPRNSDRFANLVEKIVKEGLKVYIDPDCDPDGYFSARIIKGMFDKIGYTNYVVGRHDRKRHTLRLAYVAEVFNQGFDVMVIVDSSTNAMELFQFANTLAKQIVVIDHHKPNYTFDEYPPNAVVINPLLETSSTGVVYSKLSAGALCANVAAYTLKTKFGITNCIDLYIYGFITLYSDSCDLSDLYNIAYIRAFQNQQLIGSDIISMFMNDYSHLDRNFCSFNLVPRINALMRMEEFEKLHQLFFRTETIKDLASFKEEVEAIYRRCKEFVDTLVNSCRIEQHPNYVIAYIPEDASYLAANFTGLVANRIANEYNQACLVLYRASQVDYKGSVRDPFSRDMLSLFRPLMYAAGHNSAFGIEVKVDKLQEVTDILDAMDDMFTEKKEDVIIVSWDGRPQDEVKAEMQAMSEFNEFGGVGLPRTMGVMTIDRSFKIFPGPKVTKVYGNGHKFTVFKNGLAPGDTMLITPTLNGSTYQLVVNNVKYNVGG